MPAVQAMKAALYDPLTYDNLMRGLIVYCEQQKQANLHRGSDLDSVAGPGVYSLYYAGDLEIYSPINDSDRPVYVGKAVPPGSRKGATPDPDAPALRRRLVEHSKSIGQAANLDLSHFYFRSLAVVPVWITLAERFLIDHYRPVWNLCLDGFGDHDPGSGRYQGERSWWDTLHPGRTWAERLHDKKRKSEAKTRMQGFFNPREES